VPAEKSPSDHQPGPEQPSDEQTLLMHEGDRLAAELTRQLGPGPDELRLQFIGRTLAVNLVRVFVQTVEDVTRKVGRPHRGLIVSDDIGRPEIVVVDAAGEVRDRIAVDDLLNSALFLGARLHPTVAGHLRTSATASNEHLATRALVACLKSRPVLEVSLPYLGRYTR
jgi:hypothetical protein